MAINLFWILRDQRYFHHSFFFYFVNSDCNERCGYEFLSMLWINGQVQHTCWQTCLSQVFSFTVLFKLKNLSS